MDELFKEISDSRRIRSHGNTTYLKDGRLFANEKILRGYEDAQQIKQMFSTATDVASNVGIGLSKGILPGIANLGEETMRTVLGSTLTDMFSETVNSIPGFSSLNDYFVDATTPEGTAQEISSGLGEAVGQIVVPGALISKGLKVYGYGNTFLRNVLGYGSAEAIGLKPEDDALIEMGLQVIKDDSQIAEEMLSSLSANKDLPYFMQKLQRTPIRMLEGGLLGEYAGKAIEGIGKVYSLVKNSPRLKSSLENIGTNAQESLDAGDGTTLSSMGAGEMDKAINTQLAKLAPKTFKMSPEGTRGHKVPHQLLVEGSGEKPTTLVTQTFNPTNKQTNLDNIDALKNNHPDALLSAENWLKMEQEGLGGDNLPIPPMVAINYANDPNKMVEKLKTLTPEMKAGVDEGFSYVKNIREVYQSGEATPKMTADLFVWGILSRGAGPVQQESAFIDIIDGSKDLIQKAVDGNFTEADQLEWENTIKNLMPTGSPGKQVTMNVNATGKLLFELSKKVDGSDDTVLQTLHNMIGNPNRSAKDIRREFMALTEGAGIDNKVVSFTLLVSGRDDVLVMDRIQGRHLWDDGRFEGFNLYDGYKKEGTTAKEGLQGIFRGPRGLLITEMLEDGLRKNINEVYNILGRPEDASLGRWHWENWVIEGEQVVSHSTLEAITKGSAVGTNVVEGKLGTFSSGAKYIKGKDGAVIEYPLSDGSVVYLTPERQKEFEAFIKKEKNGIVPKGFKVSENTGVPWYERPEVNRAKLDETAREFENSNIDGEVLSSSKGAGKGKNTSGSSNRTSRGKVTASDGGS